MHTHPFTCTHVHTHMQVLLAGLQCTHAACRYCGQPGHNARSCPQRRQDEQRQYLCSICGSHEHDARTCPHAHEQQDAATRGPYICSICGEQGHNAASCPQAAPPQRPARRQHTCGSCGQPGHDRRTCPTAAEAANAAAAAAQAGAQSEEEEEAEEAQEQHINLRVARTALTADNLPALFAERPECVCDSCQRTFLCSLRTGNSPRQVGGALVCNIMC